MMKAPKEKTRYLVERLVLGLETSNSPHIKCDLNNLAKGCTGLLLVFDNYVDAKKFAGNYGIVVVREVLQPKEKA